jgi:metal-dependent HD superfamily phosphatase/phosphodiesterase
MTKIHVEKKTTEELAASLDRISRSIYEELTNDRKIKTGYLAANLIELNKIELDGKIAAITDLLKKIKSLKEFNAKKKQR